MTQHPAIAPGNVAVITGGASGIGLAAAKRFAALGMSVYIADRPGADIKEAVEAIQSQRPQADKVSGPGPVFGGLTVDVSDLEQLLTIRDTLCSLPRPVTILMNNAGVGGGGHAFEKPDDWRRVIETNLFGVSNGVQAFTQAMIDHGKPAAIINTGSKQGITTPPGDTAYNVSKAGIKVLTEGLAHTLRNTPGCQVTAHLLVPGFTFTGMTAGRLTAKPPAAWTPQQVVDFMLERMAAGDFYILCPDNDVTREVDNARMTWAMQDLTQNRPPLSRWHPDYAAAFAAFLNDNT
jgi:NAD(P)-dependent dehydrogenase (short-subunit alcohol dehydrogenase family)